MFNGKILQEISPSGQKGKLIQIRREVKRFSEQGAEMSLPEASRFGSEVFPGLERRSLWLRASLSLGQNKPQDRTEMGQRRVGRDRTGPAL